jgi:hypothetical protein
VVDDGIEAGAFTIDDPGIGVDAILALTNTLAKLLSAQGRPRDDVIAVVQRLARAIVTS